ncbi:MAG: FlhC family transcriptional regulator [Methylomonas sp.]
MTLSTIKNYALAIELLSLGARTNIISEATGISPKLLSKAYVEMHQKSPPSGSLKFNPNFVYKSFSRTKEATMFVFFYRIETNQDFSIALWSHCAIQPGPIQQEVG